MFESIADLSRRLSTPKPLRTFHNLEIFGTKNKIMHRFLLHNDEIRDTGERVVSPGQVGLVNGWGVFSTIRVEDGVMFCWERHWARMERDAARLRVPFPSDAKWLEERLYRLIDANHAANSTLRVIVSFTQSAEGCGRGRWRPNGRSISWPLPLH